MTKTAEFKPVTYKHHSIPGLSLQRKNSKSKPFAFNDGFLTLTSQEEVDEFLELIANFEAKGKKDITNISEYDLEAITKATRPISSVIRGAQQSRDHVDPTLEAGLKRKEAEEKTEADKKAKAEEAAASAAAEDSKKVAQAAAKPGQTTP